MTDTTQHSRRSYMKAVGGVATASMVGLAGCSGVLGDDSAVSDHENQLTVEVEGEGPFDPVELGLTANDLEIEQTVEPGDELELERGDFEERVAVDIEYEEDIDIKISWVVDDTEVELEIDQEVWERTTGTVGFTAGDDAVTFDAESDVVLPQSTSEMTVADERDSGEWTYDIDITVEDEGEETDLEFEVDRED